MGGYVIRDVFEKMKAILRPRHHGGVVMHDDNLFLKSNVELRNENARLRAELIQEMGRYNSCVKTRIEFRGALRKSREEVNSLKDELAQCRGELRCLTSPFRTSSSNSWEQVTSELAKLQEWQKIILGTGTDQEAVIRMAAAKYMEAVIASWRDEVERLKVELARSKKDLEEARMVQP